MADVTNLGKPTQDIRTIKIDNSTIDKKKPELKIEDKSKQTLTYQPKETTTSSDKNILDNVNYLKKNLYGGTLGALTGIADVPLQETQNALQKGENIKTQKDLVKQAGKTLAKTLSPTIGSVIDTYENAKSKEKKNLIQSALDSYQGIYNATNPFTGVKEALTGIGALNTGLDEKVANVREDLNRPAEEYREKLAEESQNYGKVTNMLGTGMQQVGYMVPSIVATAITKNPELGLYGVMGASAKGSSTREAELAGADLDTAIKIGNAKAAGEVLSENLTGGLNVFGKGAIDDIALKGVDKVIKNKGLNFLAKQGLGIVGEQSEEVLTDILGYMIDKGTIDPNKKYTLDDLKQTLFDTGVSTILLNTLTGGYSPKAYRQNAQLLEQNKAQEQEKIQPNINTIEQQEKAIEEPKIEQKEVIEEQPQQEIKKEENFNDYAKEKLIKMAEKQATYSKTKEDFIKKWYSKEAEQEIGISKKQLEDIYDKAKNVNLAEEKVKEPVITAKNTKGQTIKLKQNSKNSNVYNEEAVKEDLKDLNNQFKNKVVKTKKGMEVSNFYSNITEKSKFIDTDIRNMFKNEDDLKFYNKVSNEEAMQKASKILGNTVQQQEKAFDNFISKKEQFNAIDGAQGWQLLQRFNDAGDYDRAYLVAKKMREMGTSGGQYIQSLAIQSRLTPEGMYKWAVNELMDAEQKFNSEKGRTKQEIEKYKDSFRLTTEETEFIKNQMEKVQTMEDGRAKDVEIAKINSMLQNKLPTKKGQSLKTWMRISMLFNPKTQVRNVVGNLSITPVNAISDIVSGAVDKAIAKKTNTRTIGGPSLGGLAAYGKGAIKGIKEATQDYRLGIDTKNVNQDRFDIGQGKAFNEKQTGPLKGIRNFVAKKLNATNDLLGYIMDAGDRAFYQGSVENSLYNQQKLNNSKEITNEMREIAENEGLQRTWNDNNEYTKAVLDLRRSINKIGNQLHLNVGEYGLGDLLIPFAKTPANLTKAIVDYSPVGFVNAITEGKNLKNAIETNNYTPQMQHDFSQTIGKAVAGTMLYVLGTALAKAKITSGNSDEDKDLKNFMRNNLGIQPYSIKIGDKSFTYDWAQPIAAPFAITADVEKGKQENMTPEQAIQHFLTTGFNILSEQSFMSGINEVLNNNDGILQGIEQQVVNIPSTAIPTLLKQITDLTDGTKRQTYSKEGQVANMKKTAMSKLPTESEKLAPQVDVLGNEIEKYGGDNNLFNVFLNPSNMNKGKKTPVAEEIYSLYEATQDKSIIPRKVDYSTKINGENKILTTDEMAAWQKASGSLVTKEVERAMSNSDYQNMNDEQKAKVINKIVNYSYQKAKSETFDTPLANTYNGVEKAQNKGIPIADYYISTVLKSSK